MCSNGSFQYARGCSPATRSGPVALVGRGRRDGCSPGSVFRLLGRWRFGRRVEEGWPAPVGFYSRLLQASQSTRSTAHCRVKSGRTRCLDVANWSMNWLRGALYTMTSNSPISCWRQTTLSKSSTWMRFERHDWRSTAVVAWMLNAWRGAWPKWQPTDSAKIVVRRREAS